MKKIIFSLISTLLAISAIAQTETFDIATYTPPTNWKKDTKPGVVVYSNTNSTKGTYCLLAIFASSASTGDAQKDFTNKWNDQVVTSYGAAANPKTEIQTSPDGWKAVAGAAPVKQDGADSYVILTVFSGFGKTMSVLSNFNDPAYATDIDAVLQNMKLDKTATTSSSNTVTPATPGSGKFGSMIYTTPARWNVTKYADGDILMPVGIPKDQFLEIWILPSMSFSGTMEQALQKSYDETVVKLQASKMIDVYGKNYTTVATKRSFKGWDYIRCNAAIHIGGGNAPAEFGLDLFLVKINGRFEQVAILKKRATCSNLISFYPSDDLNYHNDIENFLFSLQFADWKDPVVTPGNIKGDGITGIWEGIALTVGYTTPGVQLGTSYKIKEAIFFSNGQVYFGGSFPVEGLDGFNTLARPEENRRDWGTYSFSNGKGSIHLPYEDIPLRLENNKLILTTNKADHGFVKLNSVDGVVLNGTYAFSTKNILGQETGKTYVISFTSDGRFTDKGAISLMSKPFVPCVDQAKEPGSGTYEIKNYSVTFHYSDGRKIKVAFPGREYDKKNQSPATLLIDFNDDLLTRQ